ncbi:MAG: hypothetical protein ACREH3_03305 [Geminicoccales bacterium]
MTESGMRDVLRRGLGIGALASLASVPAVALGQTQSQELIYGGVLGDIREAETTNPGKTHVAGGLGAASADYFRGGFDDVPSDLDEIAIGPDLSVVFELWEDQPGPVRDLSLTLGTQNNFADQVQPTDSDIDKWYESNNFAALTARLGRDWLGQVAYTMYGSPNDVSPTGYELSLAGAYRGQNLLGGLKPQLKLAKPTDRGGVYTELVATPGLTLLEDGAYPITLGVPLTLGVGFDDYYSNAGTTGFVSAGLSGSVPLAFIPSDYGSWKLTAGVDLILREDDLDDAGGPFDDAGNVVPIGKMAISFVY